MNNQTNCVPEKLIQALERYNEEWVSSFPSKEEAIAAHRFSRRFERRMNYTMNHPPKSGIVILSTWGKRAACLVLVAAVSVAAALFGAKAFRDPKINYTIKTNSLYSDVLFDKQKNVSDVDQMYIRQFYRPAHVPVGYTPITNTKLIDQLFMEWQDHQGNLISYCQYINSSGMGSITIDTEGAEKIEQIDVNGVVGLYFFNKDRHHIWWCTGEYIFSVDMPGSKAAALKFAESLELFESVSSDPRGAPHIYDASPGPDTESNFSSSSDSAVSGPTTSDQ